MNPSYKPGGFREIFVVSYPLIISMGSFTLMQFVDRMFLAWHSSISLQAAVPAGILSFSLICGFMALAGYGTTFVAQYHGANDPKSCARSTAQAVFVAVLSWPVMLATIPLGRWALLYSGHPPDVIEEELIYFTILMLGGITAPLGAAISGFFIGRGHTLVTMYATVAGNVVNLFLDYVLIFGEWGFPEMGIRGAAWASVIAGFVTPAILFVIYFTRKYEASHQTRSTFRFERLLCMRLIRFGFPAGVHLALDIASFAIFILLTGRMGSVALAASNIALSVNMLAFLPMIGISIATSTLVGQYQGRRQSQYAERAAWNSVILSGLYISVIGSTYILFPEFYISFFSQRGDDGLAMEDLLPIGRVLMIIMAIWSVLDCGNLILAGALKGAGDTRFVMYFTLALAWGLLVPGQLILVFVFDVGVMVAWAWTAFYILLLAAGMTIRFRGGKWKEIEMVEQQIPILPDRPGAEAMIVGD